MAIETLKSAKKNLGSPDATKEFNHGKLELVTVGDTTVTRITLQPGWKWAEDVRPMANTENCEMRHLQYVISGRMRIVFEDGSETELGPGDFADIPPGHQASVIGNELFVCIEFSPDLREFVHEGTAQ